VPGECKRKTKVRNNWLCTAGVVSWAISVVIGASRMKIVAKSLTGTVLSSALYGPTLELPFAMPATIPPELLGKQLRRENWHPQHAGEGFILV
jgi:hypothetical protein